MKIKHLLLLLLLALCAPWTAKGQDTIFADPLTINEGTNISSTVPFRGDRVCYGTHSQFIIPQEDLIALRGGTVTKLTFYSHNKNNQNFGSAEFSVYVAEVTYTEFSNKVFVDWDSMSNVFSGTFSINANYKMEIVLDSAFTYYGGNLMIGFKEDVVGSNVDNLTWKGRGFPISSNPALVSNSNSNSVPNIAFAHFLPKMTFEYYILDYPTVEVTEGDITPNSASFSWTTSSTDVTGYKYQYNKISDGVGDNWIELLPTVTSVTLEGLDPATDYFFRIKACYGVHESAMTVVDFKTACPDYTTTPYFENFDSYFVADEWIPSNRTLPNCWDYINTSTNPNDNVYPSMHRRSTLSYYAYSPSNSLCFYIDNHMSTYNAQPQYAILPTMQNIRGLRVKLYARTYIPNNTFASTFKVGVMEETENGLDFVSVETITATNDYEPYEIDMSSYRGNGEHIAIWMEVPEISYGGVFIDDIAVEALPMFSMPIASHGGTSGGWYLISSPLESATNPEQVTQLINTDVNDPDFDLFRFNPSPDNQDMHWENWKQVGDHYHFNLEVGRGYLYANADAVNLSFIGTPYSGNGEVTLVYDKYAVFGGWNLVGNPYSVPAYIGDRAYYRMNEEGTDFVPVSDGSAINVMEGIFVYTETNGEVVTFSTTPTATRGEQLSFNVSKVTRAGLNTTFDRVVLRFGEGDALPKFQLNAASAKIYIPQNGKDYAVVTSEGQGEMPVNFRADENGTYTLSFNCENVEFSYLHLFDNKTGIDVDLLNTPSYTFNATTTDYESRFKLVFATGSSVDGDSFSFFNSNGNFSIFGIEGEATLQVIDVMGRVLSTETFSGSIEKRLNVTPGVYFIRLVNGGDVKTQKIIVR